MRAQACDQPIAEPGEYPIGHGCVLLVVESGVAIGGLDLGHGKLVNDALESVLLAAACSGSVDDGLAVAKEMLNIVADALANNVDESEVVQIGRDPNELLKEAAANLHRFLEPAEEEQSSDFDPGRQFEHVDEAIAYCRQQPDPRAAVRAIVIANMDAGEFGFASELVKEAEVLGDVTFDESSESKNTGCLEGVRCPRCGQEDRFYIWGSCVFEVTDEGSSAEGDHEWDDEDNCRCPNCNYQNSLGKFRIQ